MNEKELKDFLKTIIFTKKQVAVVYATNVRKKEGKITHILITQQININAQNRECQDFTLEEVRKQIEGNEWIVRTYNDKYPNVKPSLVVTCKRNGTNEDYLCSAPDTATENNLEELDEF